MPKLISIMVVDGSEVSRTIIMRILNHEIPDAQVTACANSQAAQQELQNRPYDLITTALRLPDGDGLDFARAVRTSVQHLYTPIIVVSSDADSRLLREGFAAGVTDYFDKSLGYERLVEFIKSFLQRTAGLVGRVLYVEDSRTAAALTRQFMEKHGLEVTHTKTAEKALHLLETTQTDSATGRERFDIVVTDFYLEGRLTGGDLLHAIRTRLHYSQQEMPVLVVTVSDNEQRQTEVFHAGANDFVTKPIVEEVLIARIRSLLLIKQQFKALKQQAEELRRLATTDSLTGVRSKRYLLDYGQAYLADTANQPVCVLLLDIDFFKRINDNLGHLTGDHVLAGLGRALKEQWGRDSLAIRFGGEEFAVLLPQCDAEGGAAQADALRQQVEELRPADVPITVSIGLASACDHPGMDLNRLLHLADKALYAAKERGRNRLCIYASRGIRDYIAPATDDQTPPF